MSSDSFSGSQNDPATLAKTRIEKQYVLPGRVFATREPYAITTILGSCIAVCLWDSRLQAGGLNHFLLPHPAGPRQVSARFGNHAMDQLLEEVLDLGSHTLDLQAKIFGGARILQSEEAAKAGEHLGDRNVKLAKEFLNKKRIAIVAEDVGGRGGRKIIFNTTDGSVLLRRF